MIEKWVAVLFAVFFGVGVAIGALWSASETADKVLKMLDEILHKLDTLLADSAKQRRDLLKMEGELKLITAMVKALSVTKGTGSPED